MQADLLITNASLLVNPGEEGMRQGAWLAMADGAITGLGDMAELPLALEAGQIIDAAGALVMPGLVNGHCHAAMSLFRGLADDLPLMRWLNEHIFPAEAAWVDPEMVYWCSKLAAAEMLLSGITLVADGYFHEDAAAQAFVDAGIRAVAGQGIIDFPAPGVPEPSRNIEAAAEFLARWQGKDPLISPALFCHSPYTCGPETLKRSKALAREAGVAWFIHLAETSWEVAQIWERSRKGPAEFLADLGVLDPQSICIHGTWLNDEDFALLQKTGAKVVICPESNMKLASGVVPLASLLAAEMPAGIGTDGCASNNRLDLFRELAACLRQHQVLPKVLFGMATSGGAEVLGLGGMVGRLALGYRADCIIVNPGWRRQITPIEPDPLAGLLAAVERGDAVSTVIIDGRLVMDQRRILTFDLPEAMTRVRKLAVKLRAGS